MMFRVLILISALVLAPLLPQPCLERHAPAGQAAGARSCCAKATTQAPPAHGRGCGHGRPAAPPGPRHAGCRGAEPAGCPERPARCGNPGGGCPNSERCPTSPTSVVATISGSRRLAIPTLHDVPTPTPAWVVPTLPAFAAASGSRMHARAGPWDGPQRTRRALLCVRTI